MSITQILSERIINYYPAELHTKKIWYVQYSVFDPYTQKMVSKRIKLNHIKNVTERRKFAQNLKREINNKLESGWNPLIKAEAKKQFVKLSDVITKYKNSEYKNFEGETLRTYNSYFVKLNTYILAIDKNLLSGNFNETHASNFCLQLKNDKKIGARTYNNNLIFFKRFFGWCVDNKFIVDNPFLHQKPINKRLIKKTRKALTREELRALIDFLTVNNPRYLSACMLIYYCCLRPDDLQQLQKRNFDFKNHIIKIYPEATKNDNLSYRVIPLALEKYLQYLNIDKLNEDEYLFSCSVKYTFAPGTTVIDKRYFSNYWNLTIRKNLNFGKELQFYSLKDTGITNLMSDGISPIFVQKQADHSSLQTTTLYADKSLPEGFDQIRNLAKSI